MKNEFIRMRLLLMFINGVILDNARGGTRTTAISKMERFVIIVNGWKALTIITKHSILDVAAVLDPSLLLCAPSKSSILLVLSSFWGSFWKYFSYIGALIAKGRPPFPGLTPAFHAISHVVSVFNTNEDVTNNWLQKYGKLSGKNQWWNSF